VMETRHRPSGLEWLGDVPWGTHFCLFYETKEDLLDLWIPYFKAGLENHEFCLCIASEPVIAEEAERALREAEPHFERYLAEGQIEIVSHLHWYLTSGRFDPLRVRQDWIVKLEQGLARGYAGMRFAANIFWLEKQDWDSFADYEGKLDEVFGKLRIIAMCAYSLARCSAADMLDVVRHHQFSVARRYGAWERLEGPELQRAHTEIRKLNADLERRVEERTAQLAAANEHLTGEIAERKRSEEALRASEARLQAAIDAADIGLWDWDLVSRQIIWLGHHDKLFGFAPGEFDGTYPRFEKCVHPEDLEELNRVVQHAREEESEYAHEYRVIWPDGRLHWIAGRGRFVYTETGQPVRMYGAVLDITERKQAEEALRQSEFDLAEAQRVARLGSWSFDIATNTIRWSDELYRIFDVEKTAFGGTYETFLSRLHPDDRTQVLQVNAEARSSGAPFAVEYRITTRSGQLRHIREVGYARKDSAGAVSGLFGTAQDITERKQAEAATRSLLQISEKLHATLDIDALLDSLVIEAMKLIDAEIGWSGLRTEEGMVCHTHIARDLQVVPFQYFC
jgi:PAS domain S-box-containing protein